MLHSTSFSARFLSDLDYLCSLADCSLLQVAYWQLLKELLTHYERRARDEQKRPPIIRVKLVNAFSTFLQLAYAEPEKNTPDRIKLLENATACLISLLSDTFQYSYRPPFEQLVTTVEQLLDVLSVQITLSEKKQEERTALDALADFAKALLKCFDTQIIQAANQRKVFFFKELYYAPKLDAYDAIYRSLRRLPAACLANCYHFDADLLHHISTSHSK